jgi:hypothetical protein
LHHAAAFGFNAGRSAVLDDDAMDIGAWPDSQVEPTPRGIEIADGVCSKSEGV